jgi:hypothetical protein
MLVYQEAKNQTNGWKLERRFDDLVDEVDGDKTKPAPHVFISQKLMTTLPKG